MKAACWLMDRFGVPEAIAGDLVEQSRCERSAWWLWRQAFAAIGITMAKQLRARGGVMFAWGLVVFGAMAVRGLFDTYAPPVNYGPRSALTTWVAIGTYLAAGCYGAYRTGRLQSGVWLAAMAHIVGQILTIGFTLALFFSVIQKDPTKLREFEMTGGFGETFLLPLMLLPVVIVLGVVGGTIGSVVRRRLSTT
jgi:hypothetical protein